MEFILVKGTLSGQVGGQPVDHLLILFQISIKGMTALDRYLQDIGHGFIPQGTLYGGNIIKASRKDHGHG